MSVRINPPDVWQPFGAFSMAAVSGPGRLVHLKGQVALNADGVLVGEGDMAAQVEQVLTNIQTVLAHLGGTMADIVSFSQFVTDIEAFMSSGAVRARFFQEPYPVTTTIEVSRLYRTDLMVEITAIAVIPEDRLRLPK